MRLLVSLFVLLFACPLLAGNVTKVPGGGASVSNPTANSIVRSDAAGNLESTLCTIPGATGSATGIDCQAQELLPSSLVIKERGEADGHSVVFTLDNSVTGASGGITRNHTMTSDVNGVFPFEKSVVSVTFPAKDGTFFRPPDIGISHKLLGIECLTVEFGGTPNIPLCTDTHTATGGGTGAEATMGVVSANGVGFPGAKAGIAFIPSTVNTVCNTFGCSSPNCAGPLAVPSSTPLILPLLSELEGTCPASGDWCDDEVPPGGFVTVIWLSSSANKIQCSATFEPLL